jgi:hypothetical protein
MMDESEQDIQSLISEYNGKPIIRMCTFDAGITTYSIISAPTVANIKTCPDLL